MTRFRQIDAAACWKGDKRALKVFSKAYHSDCGGNRDTFQRVYGWTIIAIDKALERAQ